MKNNNFRSAIDTKLSLLLSNSKNFEFKLSNISLSYPINLSADKLLITTKQHEELLLIEDLNISIKPNLGLLFWQKISFSEISAKQISLFKKYQSNTNDKKIEEPQKGYLPLLFADKLIIKKLFLSQDVLNSNHQELELEAKNLSYNHDSKIINLVLESKIKTSDWTPKNSQLNAELSYNTGLMTLEISNLSLSIAKSIMKGKANINFSNKQITGLLSYSSDILESFLKDKQNKALISGVVQIGGNLNAIDLKNNGEISFFQNAKKEFLFVPNIKLMSNLLFQDGQIFGNLQIDQQDLKMISDFSWQNHTLKIDNFRITSPTFSQTASLIWDSSSKGIDGKSEVDISNLEDLSKYLPINFAISGSGKISTTFVSTHNKQSATLQGNLKNLSIQNTKIASADFNLQSSDLKNYNLSNSILKIRNLRSSSTILQEMDLYANSSSLRGIVFASSAKMSRPYRSELKIAGTLQRSSDQLNSLTEINTLITELSGKVNSLNLKNNDPIKILWARDKIVLDHNNIRLGEGSIYFNGNIQNQQDVQATIKLKNISSKILSFILPTHLAKSLISGNFELSGTMQSPKLDIKLNLDQIDIGNNQGPAMLALECGAKNSNLSLQAVVLQDQRSLAKVTSFLPANFMLKPFTFKIKNDQTFASELQIQQPFNLLGLLPLPYGHNLSGLVSGKLLANGNILSPKFDGELMIQNGRYLFKDYGIKIHNFSTILKLKQNQANLVNFIAQDKNGNKLSANGSINFSDKMPFSLNINTSRFSLIHSTDLQGEVKGDIKIAGDKKASKLTGKISLGPCEIKIPEKHSYNIAELNIETIIDESEITTQSNKTDLKSEKYSMTLDTFVVVEKQVFVRGAGVDTMLKGSLHITGDSNMPHINGILKSERGKYQEFGRNLQVKEGSIIFDGLISQSPFLNIVGSVYESGNEIRVILSGTLQKPEIRIESSPAMNQEDAMSLLLFGENPETISPVQAIQLANSMRKLSGAGGGGPDPLAKAREILMVDNINVKTDKNKSNSTNSTSVGVGKYLTDKIYLEIEKGSQTSSPKTKLQIEVSPKISVETSKDEEDGNAIGVNWKLDYW